MHIVKMLNEKPAVAILALLLLLSRPENAFPAGYDIFGAIESRRKDNLVTILFDRRPLEKSYVMIHDDRELGKVNIISVQGSPVKGKFLVIAHYVLFQESNEKLIRAGVQVGVRKKDESGRREYSVDELHEPVEFWGSLVSQVDEREMVLIPAGKFLLGSNSGDRDEYPEQEMFLKDFYMDKFEVSNLDYKRYVDATRARPPRSWEGGVFPEEMANLPVLVSYFEAERFAAWAGKRLPTEFEWEKAARGTDDLDNIEKRSYRRSDYPWGMKFSPDRANMSEFRKDTGGGKDARGKREISQEGLISVYSLQDRGSSPFGIVNMAGNAVEWTSSWYQPYKNNKYDNSKYGKQYKVLRGGTWFSGRYRIRVTSRDLGGVPNLEVDNFAGFRCVKDVTSLDRVYKRR